MSHIVIHSDGTREAFEMTKLIGAITNLVNSVTSGEEAGVALFHIMKHVELKLPDEVTTGELDQIILKASEALISTDPLYDTIAAHQLVKIANRTVAARFSAFQDYVTYAVEQKLLDERMLDFDFMLLEQHFDPRYDDLFNFFGIATVYDRYMMRDRNKQIIEKPQRFWMRVAMGLSLCEEDKASSAITIYEKMASMKYIHSTPTLYNSGMPYSQFSSCYINVVGDSMEQIMDKVQETAMFAKFAGGVGTSVTKLRASGSHIHSINAKSSGPIPFIKIFDATVNGIMQGGRRRSSQVMYMEPRHYNIYEFLDLKETNGSPYLRTPSLNTAMWLPDAFMQRVERDQDRRLFDPHECPELTSMWGDEFTRAYDDYCDRAERGEIKTTRKVKATELYDRILFQLAKTGNYRVNFKDTHNRFNQAPSYGLIHSSNLCTEISIPNNEQSTAVCTLASLCLQNYLPDDIDVNILAGQSLDEKLDLFDREDMAATIKIAVRALDNAMTLNFYPSEASQRNTMDLRPMGLGVMGLAEIFIQLDIPFDHPDAIRLADKIGDFMRIHALQASEELGKERGAFGHYDAALYPYPARRNALLLSIAPTASISLIAGTSSGADPYFSNLYSRETLGGKFTIINETLIKQLKVHGKWNEQIKSRIIANNGSIQSISELDGIINKDIFRTAYEVSWRAQIDVTAALQKHIDQAISRNMYLQEEERSNMRDVYLYAWKQGLKGTYYCFIEKKIQGEKYTQTVNKSAGRVGFGARLARPAAVGSEVSSTESHTDTVEDVTTSTPVAGLSVQVNALSTSLVSDESSHLTREDLASIDLKHASEQDKEKIRQMLIASKGADYVEKLESGELYSKGMCPIDPFEKVMCEACQ